MLKTNKLKHIHILRVSLWLPGPPLPGCRAGRGGRAGTGASCWWSGPRCRTGTCPRTGSGGGGSSYFLTQYGWLTGTEKNHLEIGVGLMFLRKGTIAPSGTFGFRTKIPGHSFIFRAGVGVPDMIYLGLGFSLE